MRLAVLALAIAALCRGETSACTPYGRSVSCLLLPELCEANELPDSSEREHARIRALDGALRSGDAAVREAAWQWMPMADLRPLASAIRHYDELETRAWVERERERAPPDEPFDAAAAEATAPHGAVDLLERSELRWSPRSARASRYRHAIAHGEVRLGTVAVLTADQAIELAAEQGFEELDDLLTPLLAGPGRSRLRWLHTLRRNARNDAELDARAVARLLEIPVGEMTRRLAAEPGFPEAIRAILDSRPPAPDDAFVTRLSAAFKPLWDRNGQRMLRRMRGEAELPEDDLEKRLTRAAATVFPRRGC